MFLSFLFGLLLGFLRIFLTPLVLLLVHRISVIIGISFLIITIFVPTVTSLPFLILADNTDIDIIEADLNILIKDNYKEATLHTGLVSI